MNWTTKKTIGFGLTGVIVVLFLWIIVGRPIYASLAASYPEAWLKVKPGMTSDEAREVLGAPYADGRCLKGVDYWRYSSNGVDMQLNVWIRGNTNGADPVECVFRWKRFMGSTYDEVGDPPNYWME